MNERVVKVGAQPDDAVLDAVEGKAQVLVRAIKQFSGGQGDDALVAREIRDQLEVALRLPVLMEGEIGAYVRKHLSDEAATWGVLFGWLFVHSLGKAVTEIDFEELSRSWLDEWQLGRMLASVLRDFGLDERAADYAVTMVKLLTAHQRWYEKVDMDGMYEVLSSLFRDSDVQRALQVNRYRETLWFNKEAFEQIIWWLFVVATVAYSPTPPDRPAAEIFTCWRALNKLRQASEASAYQVEKLLQGVKGGQDEVSR
jgi:hypothetical protein